MIIRTRDEVGMAMVETNRSYAAGLPHSCKGSLLLSFVGSPTHFHEKSMEGGKSTLLSTTAGHHTAN